MITKAFLKLFSTISILTLTSFIGLSQTYQIVDTDVHDFYDSATIISAPSVGQAFYGQDASYSGNQPSYTDNGDGTITDNVTGLMWQKEMGVKISCSDAFIKADSMTLGGYLDWRVPTIKELYSLILFTGRVMGGTVIDKFIDTTFFNQPVGNTTIGEREIDAQTWSSTQYVGLTMGGDTTVFGVNFLDGRIKGYPKYKPPFGVIPRTMYFRMVRGNISYGINNFVDNGDGTITDYATGMMWQQADDGTTRNWESALSYAEGLTLAGHNDWRLPNAKELQSIVDYTRSPDVTNSAAIDPLFSATTFNDPDGVPGQYGYYWSGTTHMDGVNPYDGAVYVAFGKAQGKMQVPPNSGNFILMDVHGAGSQRSDPKAGSPSNYPQFFGPQGDVRYVFNYARCVRDTGIIIVGYNIINGSFTYANTSMTAMNNTKVILKELPNNKVDSIVVSVSGAYQYNNLWNATYKLEPEITKPWGGGNSTDALAIMQHFVGLNYLSGIYLQAGDVDMTGYINSADALMTQKRFVGMISDFPSGDWTWEDNNIVINGLNVGYDFQALCFGDVDGSYIPPPAKHTPKLTLKFQNDLTVSSFQSFDMPFVVNEELEVGAISLVLDYPSEYLVVEDVKLGNGESNGLLYADNNGELRISWYNLEPFKLHANKPILLIKFKAKDLTGVNSNKLSFTVKGSSELAGSNAKVFGNVDIYIPKLSVIDSQEAYSLSHNFPNPFGSSTEIEYCLKNAGRVNLRVFNVLGEEVSEIVSDYKEAGHYKVKFDGSNLSEGVYFYKINVKGDRDDFSRSRIMVISR